jgi:hypothetical protein
LPLPPAIRKNLRILSVPTHKKMKRKLYFLQGFFLHSRTGRCAMPC